VFLVDIYGTGEDGGDGRGVEEDSLTELVLYGRTADKPTHLTDDQYSEQYRADEL